MTIQYFDICDTNFEIPIHKNIASHSKVFALVKMPSKLRGNIYTLVVINQKQFQKALRKDFIIQITANYKPIDTPEFDNRTFTYLVSDRDEIGALCIPTFVWQLLSLNRFNDEVGGNEREVDLTGFSILDSGGKLLFDCQTNKSPCTNFSTVFKSTFEKWFGITINEPHENLTMGGKIFIPIQDTGALYCIKDKHIPRFKRISALEVVVYRKIDDFTMDYNDTPSFSYQLRSNFELQDILRFCMLFPQVIAFDTEFYNEDKCYEINVEFDRKLHLKTTIQEKDLLQNLNLFNILNSLCKSILE